MKTLRRTRIRLCGGLLALAVAWSSGRATAQTFNSGSTGADGPLDFTGKTGNVNFEPAELNRVLGRDIDFSDNVFHFTTIVIPQGVSIRLSAKWTPRALFWLSSGPVVIRGDVHVHGEDGYSGGPVSAARRNAIPGPGGFPGGLGNVGTGAYGPAESGFGPGGGKGASQAGAHLHIGYGGTNTAGSFLVPLVGGSGGGGGSINYLNYMGSGGGAGGGALVIATNDVFRIESPGIIYANGGVGGIWAGNSASHCGGAGAGGSVRIVARRIEGNGRIHAQGGGARCESINGGATGRIRLEAFEQDWNSMDLRGSLTTGSPVSAYVPSSQPDVHVVSVAGRAVPERPGGDFTAADVTMTEGGPVVVEIRARHVPTGTVPTLHLSSLEGADQVVQASPLVGSLAESTATVTVTFPAGFTRGFVRVKW